MPGYLITFPRTTVGDMPPEVLSRIFVILAEDGSEEGIGFSLDWITVTHVCKFWNQVARNNPALWSSIDFSHPRWAKEKLGRSKSVPLYLNYSHDEIKGDEDTSKEVLLQALNKLPLIKTVNIHGPVNVLKGFVKKMHGLPAPLIEDLRLLGTTYEGVDTALQGDFLNGIAPRLRHAAFLGFSIDLKTTLFRQIETLVLGPTKHPASILDTLTLLSNIPKLVEIRFAFTFRNPDDLEVSRLASMDPVLLPNCQFMQVIGTGSGSEEPLASSTMLLQWVKFIQPVDLEIITWGRDNIQDTVFETCEEILGPLRNHFSAEGVRFIELEMNHCFRPQRVDVVELVEFYTRSENTASVLFTFFFLNEVAIETRGELAFEFARRLPRDDLQSVNVTSVDMHEHAWRSLFGGLKHLEEIKAFLYEGLFCALYDANANRDEGPCMFPSLSRLTLYYDEEDEDRSEMYFWTDLPKLVEFRTAHGVPIREITVLPECPMPQKYLAGLPEGLVTLREFMY